MDFKTQFGDRVCVGAVNVSGDRYVLMAVGTREDERVHVAGGHRHSNLAGSRDEGAAFPPRFPSRTTSDCSDPRTE
jgi:hypothetical protein